MTSPLTMTAEHEEHIRRRIDLCVLPNDNANLASLDRLALLAEVDAWRALPVIAVCGDCTHRDTSDGACLHPGAPMTSLRKLHRVGRSDVPPAWCPWRAGAYRAAPIETKVTADALPIPMLLTCPACGHRHIDAGLFATKPHHTHACQICGVVWRPAVIATVGVRFLPGFKDEP